MSETRLHATAVLAGDIAVLIRGPSGSGKSALALSLIANPPLRANGGARLLTRLVADDQTLVELANGKLLARPHPALAGRIEMRGHGILTLPYEPVARIGLVIDRIEGQRLPDVYDDGALILGVWLPVLVIAPSDPDPLARLTMALATPPARL